MDKHSININIFGRQFPAKVNSEEAKVIQKAAKSVNEKMRAFKTQYRTQDDLDIAIMCCLDTMTELLTYQAKLEQQQKAALTELSVLEQKLDHTISLSE